MYCGSPMIWDDLRVSGVTCEENRVTRFMKEFDIQGFSTVKEV